ncbi:hypothetical protein [Paracraurococcus ruber]|uniref:Uncharacterized protein n=1 Tax=Paracraurococcus ruber TaxID=77675 RepID=A0ABS1D0K6_9PROT|nr:hypothetical protein [Paracraurococcus ruber]MBK1660125.1 hypothetical protein [Paracraurococcus ruber]TDG28020.1 hypothetical protein E2C05_21560 [Paracraurococcus ruber]
MSDIDRVFSGRPSRRTVNAPEEQHRIVSIPRRGKFAGGGSRAVEVVHVRRPGATPAGSTRPAAWSVRAEAWPEGFRAKAPAPALPVAEPPAAPEPSPPTVHVMPMWQPSPPPTAAEPSPPEPLAATLAVTPTRRRRTALPEAQPVPGHGRSFADPFGAEEGANCLRCGYLVEPARERRGLLTCKACG